MANKPQPLDLLISKTAGSLSKQLESHKLMDFIADLGVGYFGARAAGRISPSVEAQAAGFIYGLLALRLATTPGGTPAVAQATGIGMLASIGAIEIFPALTAEVQTQIDEIARKVEAYREKLLRTLRSLP